MKFGKSKKDTFALVAHNAIVRENNAIKNTWRWLCKKHADINHSIHSLRHTFATRCYEKGIADKIIQKWLGHSKVSTTVNNQYGHTKSKLELKQSNQCKSKSRDSLRNLDFLSTYLER